MSDGVGEFLDELPPVEKPVVARVPPTTRQGGDIVYMKPGDIIDCDCGEMSVKRVADVYEITGSAYHRQGWLNCHTCQDRIRITPKLKWMNTGHVTTANDEGEN